MKIRHVRHCKRCQDFQDLLTVLYSEQITSKNGTLLAWVLEAYSIGVVIAKQKQNGTVIF